MTKEQKQEAFLAKAKANQELFSLHTKLINEHLCGIERKDYTECLKDFYERQVVRDVFLLYLMEYAEAFSKEHVIGPFYSKTKGEIVDDLLIYFETELNCAIENQEVKTTRDRYYEGKEKTCNDAIKYLNSLK